MALTNSEPSYDLEAVVREIGLEAETLRIWEHRYGFPQPKRTAEGHRLYSQQDINMLRWLMARHKEGLSISRAVELGRQLEAEGQWTTGPTFYPGLFAANLTVAPTAGQMLEQLRDAWVEACVEFDEQTAELILTQAFALYSPEVTCTQLLMPALAKIGQGWSEGKFTVQQEHFASALATRRLEALLAAAPAPTRPERLLIGCPPDEEDTLGPLLLSLLLRWQGRNVIYLGPNVPLTRLESAMATVKPQLIILSAQRLLTAAALKEMAFLVERQKISLAFGGQIFNDLPALHQRIPGHYLGKTLDEASQVIDQLLLAAHISTPTIIPISETYQQALAHYRNRHRLIDALVWETLRDPAISEYHLSMAGYSFSRNIIAALMLGDMDLLGIEVAWATNPLGTYQLPPSLLCVYVEAYLKAAQEKLDERGAPVIAWLAQVVSNCDQLKLEPAP